ncbi:CHASE domain-containing protein [Pigmentibacter sp. JX0631]|uniref:CHASE domain-containing protein n=1 Tax=Pigmentibacter sp. JX0631 TaxID=2976982 RepID=UPI002469A3DC|nr:CHASE domain-containing protein [Pigmentibacter sp. JX0631]WGL61455.1 CHASE domain-containing protein [Pigmentibacter sp. JX0631]
MIFELIKYLKNIKKKYLLIPFFVFFLLLIVTIYTWNETKKNSYYYSSLQFDGIAEKANLALISQMLAYTQVLIGAKSFFYTNNNSVTREQWKKFIENLDLQKSYPGIQGIGINKFVKKNEKENHIRDIRRSGFQEYNIKPPGEREGYFPVVYIEPFINRNMRAFGFDVFSETIRKEAILKAIDTGQAFATGKITLVQETGKDVQNGFLVFLPLYKNYEIPKLKELRMDSIYGLVSAVFRMNDLIQGIYSEKFENFNLKIYDGNSKEKVNLLFSNLAENFNSKSEFKRVFIEDINNHPWTVEFSSTEAFEDLTKSGVSLLLLISGIIFSFLISIIILFLISLFEQTKTVLQSNNDLKNTQMQLIQSAKFAALGEMAGGVAHEINNPLTVISGKAYKLVRMAKKNQLDINIVEENAVAIENIVKHISKITLGLLTYSRESEEDQLEFEDIDKIIEQATILCNEKFKNNGVQLIIAKNCQSSNIYCSGIQISQVLLNLLNNAFDAIKNLSNKWIKLDVIDDSKNIFFRVSDCGPPIPDDVKEKIMQPFFTTKKIGEGTGLGLSVSRGIIEKHKGEFYLDKNVKETTFVIKLPKIAEKNIKIEDAS